MGVIFKTFQFCIVHKLGATNKVADTLSQRVALLVKIAHEFPSFDQLKELYEKDEHLLDLRTNLCQQWETDAFSNLEQVQDEYLLKGRRLCIQRSS